MRFQALNIPAFGPFTGKHLDLSSGAGRLEIIYGPNEAGKSSLLRAISTLLFGFEGRTTDDFLHPYGDLRVGGTIEHDGRVLSFMRRKGNKNTLRDGADAVLMSDDDLMAVAPVANQQVFEVMFGLDAERLSKGGRELLAGHGEFGQMLFAAAAGIEGLHSVLTGLDDEATALFKPRGSAAAISRMLAEYTAQRQRIRDAQVTPHALGELREQKETVLRRLSELRAGLAAAMAEQERLRRIRSAIGLLDQRRLVRSELAVLGDVVPLRRGFADEFAEARHSVSMHDAERQGLRQRVSLLQAEVEGIRFSEVFLAHETAIEALFQRLGAERKALADLPKLKGTQAGLESDILEMLADLREPADLEELGRLRVPAGDAKLAAVLTTEHAELSANLRNATTQVAELGVEVEQDAARLDALAPAQSVVVLEQALRLETLPEARRRDLAARAETLRARIAEDVRQLPWSGSVEDLLRAAVPAEGTVNEWRRRLDLADSQLREAEAARGEAEREVKRHETSLRRLQAHRAIATVSDLTARRDRREQGWRAVRQAWLEGSLDEATQFVAEPVTEPARLADVYEGTVKEADGVADDLREHADEAAKVGQAQFEIEASRERLAERTTEVSRKETARREQATEWAALWQPWGISAGEPAQMAEWLRCRASAADQMRALESLESELRQGAVQDEAAEAELRAAIDEVTGTPPEAGAELRELRSQAGRLVEEFKRLASARQNLEEQLAGARRKLALGQSKESRACEELAAWQLRWRQLVERLKLGGAEEPAAVQDLLHSRTQVTSRHGEYVSTKARIDGILRDRAQFESDARGVADLVAPALAGVEAMEAVRQMYEQLAAQRKARDLAASKRVDLAAEREKLDGLDIRLTQLEAHLKALVIEAGCGEPAEVPARIAAWEKRQAAQNKLDEIHHTLAGIAAGRTLEALEEEARGVIADEIPGRLENVEQTRARLEQEKDELIREETSLNQKMEGFEASTDARDAASDLQSTRAALVEETEHYVRLRLAEQLLRSAIDEFRRKSTGRLLERSSQVFAALTLGSFDGLKLEYGSDAKGQVVLVGVRPDRRTVTVEGMSEGTRDQLYLALRIASLEVHFEKHPAVPLIADDILVHFDDARAAAALGALAELAGHTQVLLFTHHRHMVELAAERLTPEQFVTYRLERVASAV
ncbi:AAA family ATPase [uncultured Paludibaculum sp.]|uniref:ATP-binding protein n=1 Tax=uncultured Paludibaculum sp. TaxID=1765020 RepID=UPI002AABA6A6|nr:AAA family ATPase [uncultured Paludibaculum sp.]